MVFSGNCKDTTLQLNADKMQETNKKFQEFHRTTSWRLRLTQTQPLSFWWYSAKTASTPQVDFLFHVLIDSGSVTYKLDLQDITITDGRLAFCNAQSNFYTPAKNDNLKYFKILFDENTLACYRNAFRFWLIH